MTSQHFLAIFSTLLSLVISSIPTQANSQPKKGEILFEKPQTASDRNCQIPVLSRLVRHKIGTGETIESIAARYRLIPATLMGMNPNLRGGTAPVGAEIVIPPYNGISVQVPAGKTFQDVAATYRIRADVLFEVNGCQQNPRVVFVPGVNWSPVGENVANNRDLVGYPLPSVTSASLGYGWQLHPILGKVTFHSGIDLAAATGTPVLAAGTGIVAYASDRGNYGNLVVINHQGGRQTRYAHLANITVRVGQRVKQGDRLGTVGTTGKPDIKEPHLHFEVRYNSNLGWVAEDPSPYMRLMKIARQ